MPGPRAPRIGFALRRTIGAALVASAPLVGIAAPLAFDVQSVAAQAATDNSTPERALAFSGNADGQVPGGLGGHFAYYKFTYQPNQTVRLKLQVTPNDSAILQYAGFKLYGPTPGREYASGAGQKDSTPSATADLFSPEGGEYVVQIYNYAPDPGATITFNLSATGLAPQPTTAPVVRPPVAPVPVAPAPAVGVPAVPIPAAPAPAAPVAPAPVATPVTDNSTLQGALQLVDAGTANGQLQGGQGGHFAFYKFVYTGEKRNVTLNLQAQPNDWAILQFVGMKVYGPTNGREYTKAEALRDANPTASTILSTEEPGEYYVQVYNYAPNPDVVVTFQLSATNLPPQPTPAAVAPAAAVPVAPAAPAAPVAPPAAATPATQGAAGDAPERAAPLVGTGNGQLAGGQGGHFGYYKFTYPGDQRRVTVGMSITPNDPALLQYAGFKVYGPGGREYLSVTGLKDANPSASGDFTSTEAGIYTVQVFSYVPNPETTITYSINVSGL